MSTFDLKHVLVPGFNRPARSIQASEWCDSVVLPFSTPLTHADMNHWKMADVWHTLMTDVLGYHKHAADGSDHGALITSQLGHKYAGSLHGIHLGVDLIVTPQKVRVVRFLFKGQLENSNWSLSVY
jgi:hypothetical protein